MNSPNNSGQRIAFVLNSKTGDELKAGKSDAMRIHELLTSDIGACSGNSPEPLLDFNGGIQLLTELAAALRAWRSEDQLIFYFSGHGGMSEGGFRLKCGLEEHHWVPFDSLKPILIDRKVHNGILILDACQSGAALKKTNKHVSQQDLDNLNPAGFATITSSGADEFSFELKDRTSSVFTSLLCMAITEGIGEATSDGNIGVVELVTFVNSKLETDPTYREYPQKSLYSISQSSGNIWIAKNNSGKSSSVCSSQVEKESASRTTDEWRFIAENTDELDMPCEDACLDDLDWDLVREFAESTNAPWNPGEARGEQAKKLKLVSQMPSSDSLPLRKNAVLSFARAPHEFIEGAECLIVYSDISESKVIKETIHGPISHQIIDATDRVMRQLKSVESFKEGARRVETKEIPEEVVRELLSNAIIHRDYKSASSGEIHFKPSELIVVSPGTFPDSSTPDEYLAQQLQSNPRNPKLVRFMRALRVFEKYGRGFQVFRKFIKANGRDSITFETIPGPAIRVTVKRTTIRTSEEISESATRVSVKQPTIRGKVRRKKNAARDIMLHIRQDAPCDDIYRIHLILKQPDQTDMEAEAHIEFALSEQEQEDIRWYMEDYLRRTEAVQEITVRQVEEVMKKRGEELFIKVLATGEDTHRIWIAIRKHLADLRIEIATGAGEAASIPWELMREPQSDSAIALRVKAFVRVQSNPNLSFVPVQEAYDGRVRLLYIVCRPAGTKDVGLRAVANRLLQDLGEDLARYDITALRPPTFEQLQKELLDAREAGRPYHIVHFDGHGIYADLSKSTLADWLAALSAISFGGGNSGKHGYLLFEHPGSDDRMRPVPGDELGKLLHDTGVPVLVLNACQSAMQEVAEKPDDADTVHDEVPAIGSLAQAVSDQGIPAVLGMRYSVFVVTAAQYIGELYASLAKGRGFGQAATEGRKHLHRNPDRWVGLQPRPLQDWFVPVVYEAMPLQLLPEDKPLQLGQKPEMDPVQINQALLRYVPDHGFVGRDETLLMLDRAFDTHPVVLLHAYAGQGKTTTAVEFARWYAQTGGLGPQPIVLLTSFESHTDLADVLNQIGQPFAQILQAHGIEWHALNDPAERRNLVLQFLRQIPVLWIWDNVEPVAGFPEGTESAWTAAEQAELADFLKQFKLDKATKVKILLTSRRDEHKWLGGIPHRVQMPRMSSADAAGLALRLGEEKNLTRSEIAHWQPLLDYCAGNPLTLRVIAGQAVKMGLRDKEQIEQFIQAVRDGEQHIEDADEAQGRDRSLGASLDYGFRNAFKEDELPVIALLHLFQGTVNVDVLHAIGQAGVERLKGMQAKEPDLGSISYRERSERPVDTYNIIESNLSADLKHHYEASAYQGVFSDLDSQSTEQFTSYSRSNIERDRKPVFLPELHNEAKEHLTEIMERATVAGLLTHLASTYYTIHPALPWFLRQLFAQLYDGQDGRSSAETALRAWVETVGSLGNFHHQQFNEGNRNVIQFLALEEANLLHARRLARRHGWWPPVISAMQGLQVLYRYQGRGAEWARLVAEIVPDYCTEDDEPVPGREDEYSLVMEYRVDLALEQERDLTRAAELQGRAAQWNRHQAAALALPGGTPLDDDQRNRIHTLAMSTGTLGQILREQGSGDCVEAYEETIRYAQRIKDAAAEAIAQFNLGHAYKDLPDIRNLDAAEAAYQRSLALHEPNDALGRSRCIKQIGMVHHERFREARQQEEPPETLLQHAQAAEQHYQQALDLRPASAIAELGPMHNQLGQLYKEVGQTDRAREHYEKATQYFEQTGDRYHAGQTRQNMAVMYARAGEREETPARQRELLLRGQAYARAALRDYQHYEGRAAADEAEVQRLLDAIGQALAALPQ